MYWIIWYDGGLFSISRESVYIGTFAELVVYAIDLASTGLIIVRGVNQ